MNDIERQIDDIRTAKDLVFSESVKRRILGESIQAGDVSSPQNQTVDGLSAITAPEAADAKVLVTIDGADYYIQLYNV